MANTQLELSQELRLRAGKMIAADEAINLKELPLVELQKMLHELRVYQIELEMQNEQLREVQHDMEWVAAEKEEVAAELARAVEGLEKKNAELERMNRLFIGRELRMVELKERIRELEKLNEKAGQPKQCR